jgi:hypothetical protein
MLELMLLLTVIGTLTSIGMNILQSRLNQWDDSRRFRG